MGLQPLLLIGCRLRRIVDRSPNPILMGERSGYPRLYSQQDEAGEVGRMWGCPAAFNVEEGHLPERPYLGTRFQQHSDVIEHRKHDDTGLAVSELAPQR